MASHDKLVKLLNDHGYQPVFLPVTGLEPPELYNFASHPSRLVRRGPLATYIPGGTFHVVPGQVAAIEGKQTTGKHAKAAVDFLSSALRCIGIDGAPKLDLGFTGASELIFAFTGITSRRVDVDQIDLQIQAIKTGAIPADTLSEGRLHIVYEYLYAEQLTMQRNDATHFEHDISAKVGQYLDLGSKGNIKVEGTTKVSFSTTDNNPAAFAFKAGRLTNDQDGKWGFYPEETMLAAGPDGAQVSRPYVIARGVVLEVEQQA